MTNDLAAIKKRIEELEAVFSNPIMSRHAYDSERSKLVPSLLRLAEQKADANDKRQEHNLSLLDEINRLRKEVSESKAMAGSYHKQLLDAVQIANDHEATIRRLAEALKVAKDALTRLHNASHAETFNALHCQHRSGNALAEISKLIRQTNSTNEAIHKDEKI